MAEGVVDLLELVEVDEEHRNVAVVGLVGEDSGRPLPELHAVRQPRQRIEPRELVYPGLGEVALGDVLEQHDGAAVLHGLAGQVEHPAVAQLEEELARKVVLQMRLEAGYGGLDALCIEDPGRYALGKDVAETRKAARSPVFGQFQEFAEHAVGDRDATVGVEHRQPRRHVVERRIELRGEQAKVARAKYGFEEDAAQANRYRPHRNQEGNEDTDDVHPVAIAGRDHTRDYWRAGAYDENVDEVVIGEIAAGDAHKIRHDARQSDKLAEFVIEDGEIDEKEHARQRHVD